MQPLLTSTLVRIWNFGLVLWVCRVPIASTALACVLLVNTPQGRDFFADLGMPWLYWAVFLVLCFCWAWIVHSGARQALRCDDWVAEAHQPGGLDTPQPGGTTRRAALQDEFKLAALWVPRALGVIVLLLVGWGLCRTWRNMNGASAALDEAAAAAQTSLILLSALIVVIAIFSLLVWKRRIWIAPAATVCLDRRTPIFADWFGAVPAAPSPTRTDKFIRWARRAILLALVVAICFPLFTAAWIPRLFFVPLLFSGIVLFLGEIACWSHRLRTPLLLMVVVISLISVNSVERYHDVRWLKGHPATDDARQIAFDEAVNRWMTANDCQGEPAKCPRPLLIAGAGGASRAAFLTASVVGALLDLDLDLDNASAKNDDKVGTMRSRIFAMSTVSGSSIGAGVVRAALTDALRRGTPNTPPCITAGTGSWYGNLAMEHASENPRFDVTKSWRSCFQAILAGDFLSPVFIGIVYRDNFPITNPFTGNAFWGDRAELLEQAFEARYNRMTVGGRSDTCRDFAEYETGEETGLCRRFGYHPAVGDRPEALKRWVPLLFINATSVTTGRRVIVSDIRIGSKYGKATKQPLLPFAYDLWELRDDQTSMLPDIRLSTAVGLSARFPVISPYGAIRDGRDRDIVDQVVDGGYFENDGLATIADVAQALKEYDLTPVVIRVVNDPQPLQEEPPLAPDRPARPHDDARTPFEGIASIFRALTATRSGHEDGHAAYLRAVLGQHDDRIYPVNVYSLSPNRQSKPRENPAELKVASQLCRRPVTQSGYMEFVSMSWWMSQPVQAYLDAQLCIGANVDRLVCELVEGGHANGHLCKERAGEKDDVAVQ